jgi:hypothetical protein
VLLEGAVGAVILILVAFLLSRFTRDIIGRSLLIILLFIAAGAYFGFVVASTAGPIWLLIETLQCVVFGAMALASFRGSPWWLAAAWALHPAWDVAVHYMGPGQSFAPWTYVIACLSFDLVVAAYIALVYGLGLLGRPIQITMNGTPL